jgi:periplasmic glucans biosynthesis protein
MNVASFVRAVANSFFVVAFFAGLWGLACHPARAQGFGFEDVSREAQTLAQTPFRKPQIVDLTRAALGYDAYRRIQFRAGSALWHGQGTPFEMHFFPLGNGLNRALRLFEVVDGKARTLTITASAFNNDGVLPPEPPDQPVGIAGWRLTYPLNEASKRDEVVAFVGASYFRALGQAQRYGLSARAVAVDTTGAQAEEFPDFVAFWFERPSANAKEFSFYALLDGPRLTGAYHFVLRPGASTAVDVRSRLFLRAPITTLGIAPLTSMFLHGENQLSSQGDFRPEVHDSDGLQILTAEGEWIWRPLTNPGQAFVTSFAMRSPRGFGLMQRDRAFASYEDIEARYELRPSAWIEPLGDWGAGRVELLQFNTPDETHDNVAAFWVPDQRPEPGVPIDLAWRVHWVGNEAKVPPGARVVQTRAGYGYFKGQRPRERHKLLIDFSSTSLPAGANPEDVEAVTTINSNARLVRVHTYPNTARGGWRTTVEFDRVSAKQAVELRIFLRLGANTLSETWSYALPPELAK